jgi:hypothetical protein
MLAVKGFSQNLNDPPNLSFSVNFLPLPGSPDDPYISGGADYYRTKAIPFGSSNIFTNWLEFGMTLSAAPLDSWIVERQLDGSFAPVVQITNLIDDSGGSGAFFLRPAPLTLTTNQIYSLIASNWYFTVDFGDSNYLGNLTPMYNFAHGPAAVANFSVFDTSLPNTYVVIATNNRDGQAVFDGSNCTDPFYFPMQYEWAGWAGWAAYDTGADPVATGSGIRSTNVFATGTYVIQLQVSDKIASGSPAFFSLNVMTGGQAVNSIVSNLQYLNLPSHQKQRLMQLLSDAAAEFDGNRPRPACARLKLFAGQINAMHISPSIASIYSTKAQYIINAFENRDRRHDRG